MRRTFIGATLYVIFVSLSFTHQATSQQASNLSESTRTLEQFSRKLATESQSVVQLTSNGTLKVEIKADAAKASLETGQTPALLFRLPESRQYELSIRSLCKCFGFAKKLFVPRVLILDSDFRATAFLDDSKFAARMPEFRDGRWASLPLNLSVALAMDDARVNDRYLLVYTDARREGKPVVTVNQRTVLYGMSVDQRTYSAGQGSLEGTLLFESGPLNGEDLAGDWTLKANVLALGNGRAAGVRLAPGASADALAAVKIETGRHVYSGQVPAYKDKESFKNNDGLDDEIVVWVQDGRINLWAQANGTPCEANYKAKGASKGTCTASDGSQWLFQMERRQQK